MVREMDYLSTLLLFSGAARASRWFVRCKKLRTFVLEQGPRTVTKTNSILTRALQFLYVKLRDQTPARGPPTECPLSAHVYQQTVDI